MLKLALGIMFLGTQLTGVGTGLPAVLKHDLKTATVKAGQKADVVVSFNLMDGYAINRTPPMNLKLTGVSGVSLAKSDFTTSPDDPKSKDEYYVDLPKISVPVTAAKPGKYEIPGKLVYFFCSKADGFCARNILDFKIPVNVQ